MKILKKSKDAMLLHNILFTLTKNKFNEFKFQSALKDKIIQKVEEIININDQNENFNNQKISAIKTIISKFVKFHQIQLFEKLKNNQLPKLDDFVDNLHSDFTGTLNRVPSKNKSENINSYEKENDKLGITNISKFNSTRNFEDTDSEDSFIEEKFDHSIQDTQIPKDIPKDIPKSNSLNNTKKLDTIETQNIVSFSSLNENETEMHLTESDNFNTMVNTKLQDTKDNNNDKSSKDNSPFNHNDQIDDK